MTERAFKGRWANVLGSVEMARAEGVGYLGVAAIGLGRLLTGGSRVRATSELVSGSVLAAVLIPKKETPYIKRMGDAAPVLALASVVTTAVAGLSNQKTSGAYEKALSVATIGTIVAGKPKEL